MVSQPSYVLAQTEFRNVAAQLAFIDSENLNNGKTFAPAWNDLAQVVY